MVSVSTKQICQKLFSHYVDLFAPEPQSSIVHISSPRPTCLGHRCSEHKLVGSHCLCLATPPPPPPHGCPSQGIHKIRQWSAIVDTLGPVGHHISQSSDLSRLLSRFHRDRPKSARNLPKWNFSDVLNELTKASSEPMKDIDLKHLTLKTFLLALPLVSAAGKFMPGSQKNN